jgi:hypothetical protein
VQRERAAVAAEQDAAAASYAAAVAAPDGAAPDGAAVPEDVAGAALDARAVPADAAAAQPGAVAELDGLAEPQASFAPPDSLEPLVPAYRCAANRPTLS